MRLLKIYLFTLLLSSNQILVAQEDVAEGEAPSTVQQLLELVKEGQVREQSENAVREAEFMANKSKQVSILAAEEDELDDIQGETAPSEASLKDLSETVRGASHYAHPPRGVGFPMVWQSLIGKIGASTVKMFWELFAGEAILTAMMAER